MPAHSPGIGEKPLPGKEVKRGREGSSLLEKSFEEIERKEEYRTKTLAGSALGDVCFPPCVERSSSRENYPAVLAYL